MATTDNLRQLAERAKILTRELREIVGQMLGVAPSPESAEKTKQLREVSRTIERLESSRVSVPAELRNLKTTLLTEVSLDEEVGEALETLRGELESLQAEIQNQVPASDQDAKPRCKRTRSNSPRTDKQVLREFLLKSLKAHGGRASIHDALKWMQEHLQSRFLPGDLEIRSSGEVVWENNTCWERYSLVQEGILKNDSPRGVWELNGEHH
jgi:prefoldin subunit 5